MASWIDFSDTETTFRNKTDRELRKAVWLFGAMRYAWLVKLVSKVGEWAVKWRLPLVRWAVKVTIFDQFVGGETLAESQSSIERLWESRILTVLDYGAEGKDREQDFDAARDQFKAAIDFAAAHHCIPVVSIKVTALAPFALLEAIQLDRTLSPDEEAAWQRAQRRTDAICDHASQQGVRIFIDAEESWIQDVIDRMAEQMMDRYNRKEVVVYHTFQLYRHGRYAYLLRCHQDAQTRSYLLGAKLVRGAYMEKERRRARQMGQPSPIQANKQAVDTDFDRAVRYCVDHYQTMAMYAATHNEESCRLLAELIADRQLQRDHPHLNFCQLYGMSDHITYNLAAHGYNVAKYVVYGQVYELVPYLSRRAAENTAAQGEFGREYKHLITEYQRRRKERSK